jgi:hypothetical protein
LSALTLSDRQQGLIDPTAANAISSRTATLLNALASRDSNQAAHQLTRFARGVDALAASGHVATAAAADALKAAAAGLANALIASWASSGKASSTSGDPDAGSEAPVPADTGKGRGHRHDGASGKSQD